MIPWMPYVMSKIIECRNVCKSFIDGERELHILRGVNLEVHDKEIVTIVGPSGVGKSTLLHIIGTLDRPTNGEVLFRGKPLTSMGRHAINTIRGKEIGFVFQFYHLLPEFTAIENLMMPALALGYTRRECRERAEYLLGLVGLADRMEHKPGQLSGGEQQRVAIGRALFNRPSVVLADEPTGNLDERTGEGIIHLLWKLNCDEGLTLVLVSHEASLATQAHRNIHLHEGEAYEAAAEPSPS